MIFQVSGFLQSIRDAAKQGAEQSRSTTESSMPRNNSSPNLPAEGSESQAVFFPLWYVGRVIVSHRQAPPTLVDELVERFKKRTGVSDLEKQLRTKQDERKISDVTNNKAYVREHYLAKKANSLDSAELLAGNNSGDEKPEEVSPLRPQLVKVNSNPGGRPRSASDGDKTKEVYCSSQTNSSTHNQHHVKTHSRNSSLSNVGQNRNVLFKISIQSLSCLSVSTKAQLMERRLREVSFCQQVCGFSLQQF